MGGVFTRSIGRTSTGGGSDPYWSNVKLLCGFEGADGSTTLIDESSVARALTAQSTAQIDTAQFKYGASSLLLNGTSDYVTAADSADFEFGSGEFTIEGFFRFSSLPSNATLLEHFDGTNGWALRREGGALKFNGITYTLQWNGFLTINTNQWYHLAVDRDASGHTRIYADGVMQAKSTATNAINAPTGSLYIGRAYVAVYYFPGHMDELRITKGNGRYASDGGFTVPASAYPRS